jgi:GNAT superfamily N-acetyltransferase
MTLEFTVDPDLTEGLRAEIVACWADVTNAGGSVGFVPPVTMDDVLPFATRAFAGVAAGHDRLIIGRDDVGGRGGGTGAGRLVALAFLVDERSLLTEHWRMVKRVMVHPDFQGRRYGTLLMAEVERTARVMGLEMLALDCRAGTGNDEFYKKCGYVEHGRLPGALRIGPDDYRDRVLMAMSLRG